MAIKALIVDDNEAARQLVRNLWETLGYQVAAEADNLKSAVEAYQKLRPGLVFLDLALEHEDGLTILKGLLKIDAAAKVIVVSANSQDSMVQHLLKSGATAFLAKPFALEQFKKTVDGALGPRI